MKRSAMLSRMKARILLPAINRNWRSLIMHAIILPWLGVNIHHSRII